MTAAVPAPLADPAERGTTTIAPRVVEQIAAQATTEVAHAAGLRRSLVGQSFGRPQVRADAELDGKVAGLSVDLAVDYPAPVRQVSRAVRRRIIERLDLFAGVEVDHVDIRIAALRRPSAEQHRRVL